MGLGLRHGEALLMRLRNNKDVTSVLNFIILDSMGDFLSQEELDDEVIRVSGWILSDMDSLEREVDSAKRRVPHWNGSPVEVAVSSLSEDIYNEDQGGYSWTLSVYVGEASFTHLGDKSVGDILEDFQDFSSREEMEDYQNLVSELLEPNSTRTTKTLTLYTAQPRGFEKERFVREGMFFTSDASDALGLARDRGREVYQVKIPRRFLLETKSGSVKWYQSTKRVEADIIKIS